MAVTRVHGEHRDAKIAGEDLSNSLFYAAVVNDDGELELAGENAKPVGFIFETAPAGRPATVATGGLVNAVAAGAIDAGEAVSVASDGRVVAATEEDAVAIGTARNSVTAANQVVEVYFN